MSKKPTLVFAGGGTGGHLFPAIAVAQAITERSAEYDIHFVGRADKLEASIVPNYGYSFHPINVEGFSRANLLRNFIVLAKFCFGYLQALRLMIRLKPVSVITTGAYISAPVIVAARTMGHSVYMIEPNSYPGLTTRLLEGSARVIFIAFEETKKYLRNKSEVLRLGNPVRPNMKRADRAEAKVKLGFPEDKKLVFITGGSLGAKAINQLIASTVNLFNESDVVVLWQTGKMYFEAYKSLESATICVRPFVEDMMTAMNAADLVICRSGATTIAELTFLGVASVLIPSPNVAENHQYFNAKSLADHGAAILLEEKDSQAGFPAIIKRLLNNPEELESIRQQALKLSPANAAEKIARQVIPQN